MTTPRRRKRTQAEGQGQITKPQGAWIQFPVRWVGTDEVPIMMANQIFVRYQDGQVVIAFGQGIGPYELQMSKDTEDKLRREGMPVRPVAQIAVAPSRLALMIEALSGLLTRIPQIAAEEAELSRVKQP